jgi:aminoglycoside phosphotransferase (APT) family kinase protein
MIPGAHSEARWVKPEPRRTLAAQQVDLILRTALPGVRVLDVQPLVDGLRNANFKLRLESPRSPVILRLYEHDASLCQKEADIIRAVRSSIPVPQIIHAEPSGLEDIPPFAVFRFVEAISFRELKRCGDRKAIAQAAQAAGETLANISRIEFPGAGWLGPGPEVKARPAHEPDAIPTLVDACLASVHAQRRMDAHLRELTHAVVWKWAPRLRPLGAETRLVRGDFGKRNLLVHSVAGTWSAASVLDWEFALSGSPLADLGQFLRYEWAAETRVEFHFSDGYRGAGGSLSSGWRELARLVDLANLCESLTHEYLPDAFAPEIVDLVRATVEDCARKEVT